MPFLLAYASKKAETLATFLINDAIGKKVVEELTIENLFFTTKDTNGNIVSIDFNSAIVNKILSTSTKEVEQNLRYIEEGRLEELELSDHLLLEYQKKKGLFYAIPLGVVFENPILSNFGPKIPFQFHFVGSITSTIETKITNYGINNAMIEVYVHLFVQLEVLLPFLSKQVEVDTLVPIALKLMPGNIPEYYAGNLSSPLFSLPLS